MKHGDKVKITVVFEAEIVTDLESVSESDLELMMFNDDSFGLKSIVAGICESDPEKINSDHDTELLFHNCEITVTTNA